jgi:hypothetical protein
MRSMQVSKLYLQVNYDARQDWRRSGSGMLQSPVRAARLGGGSGRRWTSPSPRCAAARGADAGWAAFPGDAAHIAADQPRG